MYEIRNVKLLDEAAMPTGQQTIWVAEEDDEVNQGKLECRAFIAQHCHRTGGKTRYAIKRLSPDVVANPARFIQGIFDMAIETRLLGDIEHPNIIKLRAISKSDLFSEGYFIVMDRLYDIMDNRLKVWAARRNRTTGLAERLHDRSGQKAAALYEERVVYAFDLADAISYLHKVRRNSAVDSDEIVPLPSYL